MYLLTLKTRRDDGAYAVQDKHGDKAVSYTHLTLPTK